MNPQGRIKFVAGLVNQINKNRVFSVRNKDITLQVNVNRQI